jgi:hypothetical protein
MRIVWTAGEVGVNLWRLLMEGKELTCACSEEDGSTYGFEEEEPLACLKNVEHTSH